ncbi:Trimethyllysine dioxygenase [Apiospora kogelbergensis]|uniref:Trimethyllysine dioxygenase n=1 Tax=Apiospora kogelbergensis TaxID=1337665 RepID=UPI003130F854
MCQPRHDAEGLQHFRDVRPEQIDVQENGVRVQWSDASHDSFYPWDFIETYIQSDRRTPEPRRIEYFGSNGSGNSTSWPPSVSSKDLEDNETRTVAQLTDFIVSPICHPRHTYDWPSAHHEAETIRVCLRDRRPFRDWGSNEKAAGKIAFIRQTHYGGFYDFIPDLAMADTAYTNLALGAHTDTTYFTDPAGLQAFHLLSHADPTAKDGEGTLGGKSLLVDGFYAASLLRKESPRAYKILTTHKLSWHASGNEGITITPDTSYPVLESKSNGQGLRRVRWNNDDRGVVPFTERSPMEWYEAAREWHSILTRKDLEYWVQLTPGNLLIFDNWRVLHGRSAFTGVRRMCGGYINRDDFVSRWRNTNFPREEILKRVVG